MSITAKKAIDIVKNKHPELTVCSCIDYDQDHYIISAYEDPKKPPVGDGLFGVNKKTGALSYFSPAGDIGKFAEAASKRTMWSIKNE